MVRSKALTSTTDQSIDVKMDVHQVWTLLKEQEGWHGKLDYVDNGTTIGTYAILEGKGAKARLVVTSGHRDVLDFIRSQIPGGLGGWINWRQTRPDGNHWKGLSMRQNNSTTTAEIITPVNKERLRKSLSELNNPKARRNCSELFEFIQQQH